MKAKHLRPFVGAPVIVQLRDAMAIGEASGGMQPAVHVNKEGKPLLRDGTIATKESDPKEIGFVESWPVDIRKDGATKDFRFAIVGRIAMYEDDDEVLEVLYEAANGVHMGLVVDVANVVGITHVKSVEKQSRIVSP